MNPELRYHITSGDWVLISPKRKSKAKPDNFEKKEKRKIISKIGCPFEDPQKFGNSSPSFWYPGKTYSKNWKIQILENKFPALSHPVKDAHSKRENIGVYIKASGIGFHDLLITRNHFDNFADLDGNLSFNVLKLISKKITQVSKDGCIKYVSVFQNWGPTAGASIFHPHYQIISLPIIPNDVSRSLSFSEKYYKENQKCIHCQIIKDELKFKERIVYQDKDIIAFCPFASKEPYQVNIFPKKHLPFFEDSPDAILKRISNALKIVLLSIKKNVSDPDYNWFIHTGPITEKNKHQHYHWHIEVVPKSNISGGFELGTGIEVNAVPPEDAAKELRSK